MSPLMIPLVLNAKFNLGTLCFTAGIRGWAVNDPEFAKFIVVIIQRHANGDWGDLGPEDKKENEFALDKYLRIFSAYNWKEEKIWIITEADRSLTTVLFPNEY